MINKHFTSVVYLVNTITDCISNFQNAAISRSRYSIHVVPLCYGYIFGKIPSSTYMCEQ